MLSQILTGQTRTLALLLWAVVLFLYFLPAILSFMKAQRRFYVVLVLNILLGPAQGFVLLKLAPQLIATDTLWHATRTGLLADIGVAWPALLIWTFLPGAGDPRLLAARASKAYDAVVALPLMLWFAYGLIQLYPSLIHDIRLIQGGAAPLFNWVRAGSLICVAGFDLLLIWTLLVRDKPVAKAQGALPRVFGFVGTFLGVGIIQLPVAQLTMPVQILAALLIGLGNLASFVVLWRLGKSFSIMPEARTLRTGGPYALARHPLYTAEMITIIGTAIQFQQPQATVIAVGVALLLVIRSVYEERVLSAAFPAEYAVYRATTKRFIPGVI
jgi:protein-S-isoprenylcysteine O-methyltransferase Ste14